MQIIESKNQSSMTRAIGYLFSAKGIQIEADRLGTSSFRLACRQGEVTRIYVQECLTGYSVFVVLKNSVTKVLSTPANLVRNWSSLNSLMQFLRRNAIPISEITIRLNEPSPNHFESNLTS
jgi:hypothetical protein